ncbi:unnamed protein product, partial [Amoebophrya sp. A25]
GTGTPSLPAGGSGSETDNPQGRKLRPVELEEAPSEEKIEATKHTAEQREKEIKDRVAALKEKFAKSEQETLSVLSKKLEELKSRSDTSRGVPVITPGLLGLRKSRDHVYNSKIGGSESSTAPKSTYNTIYTRAKELLSLESTAKPKPGGGGDLEDGAGVTPRKEVFDNAKIQQLLDERGHTSPSTLGAGGVDDAYARAVAMKSSPKKPSRNSYFGIGDTSGTTGGAAGTTTNRNSVMSYENLATGTAAVARGLEFMTTALSPAVNTVAARLGEEVSRRVLPQEGSLDFGPTRFKDPLAAGAAPPLLHAGLGVRTELRNESATLNTAGFGAIDASPVDPRASTGDVAFPRPPSAFLSEDQVGGNDEQFPAVASDDEVGNFIVEMHRESATATTYPSAKRSSTGRANEKLNNTISAEADNREALLDRLGQLEQRLRRNLVNSRPFSSARRSEGQPWWYSPVRKEKSAGAAMAEILNQETAVQTTLNKTEEVPANDAVVDAQVDGRRTGAPAQDSQSGVDLPSKRERTGSPVPQTQVEEEPDHSLNDSTAAQVIMPKSAAGLPTGMEGATLTSIEKEASRPLPGGTDAGSASERIEHLPAAVPRVNVEATRMVTTSHREVEAVESSDLEQEQQKEEDAPPPPPELVISHAGDISGPSGTLSSSAPTRVPDQPKRTFALSPR